MARKGTSRTARWMAAIADARTAYDAVEAAKADLEAAMSALDDVRQEYEDWKDNLPENLASSALGEKLDAVASLDLDWDGDSIEAVAGMLDEADGVDLPLGFGRD